MIKRPELFDYGANLVNSIAATRDMASRYRERAAILQGGEP